MIHQPTSVFVNHPFLRLSLDATAWVGWEPDEGWQGEHKGEDQQEQQEREYQVDDEFQGAERECPARYSRLRFWGVWGNTFFIN